MIIERRLIKKKMINFKKVASILASGVMLASTISFAAAANLYPKPFTDGAAIVYGSNAASTDMAGSIDIYDQLKTRATGSVDASVAGEAKSVETASQPLYLGDYMNKTKETFSKDELPTILKNGKVTDDDGTELNYELKVDVLKSKIIYGDTSDNLATPIVYADTGNKVNKYSLRIIFPTAANMTKLTDEAITLFGKPYVFTGSKTNLISTAALGKAVLFEKAVPVIVNDGESVTAEGHTISAAVEDADTASITIDGVTDSHDEGWSGKIGTVDVYIKNVVGPNVAGTSRYVEIYLNSNKLTLSHANEVKVGSTDVSGTNVTFTTSGDKTTEIKIDVDPYEFDDSIKYLKQGDSFTDPVFGGIKFNLVSITPELDASTRDEIVIKATGEKTAGIKFTNKAGKLYDMDILRNSVSVGINASYYTHNATAPDCKGTVACGTAFNYNATELGIGADYDLIAYPAGSSNATIDSGGAGGGHGSEVMINENDYFITCSNEYTQIWRLKSIKTTATVKELKVEDQGSGSETVTVTLSDSVQGSTGTLTLGDGSTTTLTLNTTLAVTSDKACSYLYTKSGAKIRLDKAGYTATNDTITSQVIVEEETGYNGGDFKDASAATLGKNITLQLRYESGRTGKDIYLVSSTPSGTLDTDYWTDDVGDYDDYYVTKYGSFVKLEGNTDNIGTVYYPENAMKIGFYIGEVTSEITPGTTGVAGGQIAIVKDSEVSTVASKHLIVVGGSCVNTVAAKILNSDAPLCGADFSTATKVGAGGYIIKTVDAATAGGTAGKVAMLVAGYDAADTISAIKRAMIIDGVKTDVGSEEIWPVVA